MCQGLQGDGLFLLGPFERQANVRLAKIGRKEDLSHRGTAHAGIRHLIADQLFQFLSDVFGQAFSAMGSQILE